jgi:hypothetical protein
MMQVGVFQGETGGGWPHKDHVVRVGLLSSRRQGWEPPSGVTPHRGTAVPQGYVASHSTKWPHRDTAMRIKMQAGRSGEWKVASRGHPRGPQNAS